MFRPDILWFIPAVIIDLYQPFFVWGRLKPFDDKDTEISGIYTQTDHLRYDYLYRLSYIIFYLQLVFVIFPITTNSSILLFFRIGGNFLIISGLILSVQAINQLKDNWTGMFYYRIKKRQKLVTDDVYCFIRHPIYSSIILKVLGFELIVNSWLIFPVLILVIYEVYKHSLNEEKLLLFKFKKKYSEYQKKTKMFIPYIF